MSYIYAKVHRFPSLEPLGVVRAQDPDDPEYEYWEDQWYLRPDCRNSWKPYGVPAAPSGWLTSMRRLSGR